MPLESHQASQSILQELGQDTAQPGILEDDRHNPAWPHGRVGGGLSGAGGGLSGAGGGLRDAQSGRLASLRVVLVAHCLCCRRERGKKRCFVGQKEWLAINHSINASCQNFAYNAKSNHRVFP